MHYFFAQEQLAKCTRAEMYRSLATVMHAVCVFGAGRVLCCAFWHAIRQALAAQKT